MYSRGAARCGDPGTPKSSLLMNGCSLTFTQSVMVSLEFAIVVVWEWSIVELEGRELLDNELFEM